MALDSPTFFEKPILNSPYEEPQRHHALDADGQPLNEPPRDGRRRSEFITPVPRPRKKKQKTEKAQGKLGLETADGVSADEQEYNPTPIINEIRGHLAIWRAQPQASWGVTPATARLLNHWRNYPFQGVRPFFCQIEAVEAVIWFTEVAKGLLINN
jgi:type III restriction enzyme